MNKQNPINIFAESIQSALADLESKNTAFVLKYKTITKEGKKVNTLIFKYEWWKYLGYVVKYFRKLVAHLHLIETNLRVPSLPETVKLWLQDDLINFHLDNVNPSAIQTQRKINNLLQNIIDNAYYDGDIFLTALTITYSKSFPDALDLSLTSIKRESKEYALQILKKKAQPYTIAIEDLLLKDYSNLKNINPFSNFIADLRGYAKEYCRTNQVRYQPIIQRSVLNERQAF